MTKIKETLFKFVEADAPIKTIENVTWIDILINALILAGLGFFSTISGMALLDIKAEPLTALLAASIAAGLQFFISLSIQRGLREKD